MGERRAIGGYHPQYRVAAGLVLRALRDGTLESIRIADPEAGRVDDLQISTPGRLDAYQIKWSKFPQTITFHDLLRATPDKPSLIHQLADGWRRLKSHSGNHVTVHLLTDDFPSTNDHVPGASQPQIADHFAAFLAEEWNPRSQQANHPIATRWSRAWTELSDASGLEPSDFDTFVLSCRFDLGYRLPDDAADEVDSIDVTGEARVWISDLDRLQLTLYSVIPDQRQIIQLTRDALLDRLGWRQRVEFRSRHEFPPTTIPYEEIRGTAAELFHALETETGGYFVLLGTPGSASVDTQNRPLIDS
jgi:hypothetical protein